MYSRLRISVFAAVALVASAPVKSQEEAGTAPVTAPPDSRQVGAFCPTQVAPEFPIRALRNGESGTVIATVRIEGGLVAKVLKLEGPEVFFPAVVAAFSRYKCADSAPVVARQAFVFAIDGTAPAPPRPPSGR
jgi:hypothetical protein